MTKTDTRDAQATLGQVRKLTEAGCEVVRIAVPDEDAARALTAIRAGTHAFLVSDIHFNYRLAIMSMEAGVDKLRINPGNIGGEARVREVVRCAADRDIPIRIGVNAGSLEPDLLARYGMTPRAMVESARRHVGILESFGFEKIVVSLKASDVWTTVEAYRLAASVMPYPLHLGLTEAGPPPSGIIRSAVALGILLGEGIGDTIRVSLTGDPIAEVHAGREILQALGLRRFGPVIISCPTCGRSRTALAETAEAVRRSLAGLNVPITVAIMGCEVNGPGEARHADVGLACGAGFGLLFRRGEAVRRVPEKEMVSALVALAHDVARNAAAAEENRGSDRR
jgi:(E)-4-hydroxy-3-methylbut-2-enyl-diphosphate synthase